MRTEGKDLLVCILLTTLLTALFAALGLGAWVVLRLAVTALRDLVQTPSTSLIWSLIS